MSLLTTIKNNIPNAITSLNLMSGSLACVFAIKSNEMIGDMPGYEWAFVLIAMAAVFDFCDGFAARLLHAVSGIGKELDSLSDAVSFGLAPALLVYAMIDHFAPGSIWSYAAMIISVFGALRLARFNIDTTQTTSFVGLPIPANAIFWVGYCSWIYGEGAMNLWATLVWVLVLSGLMVSRMRIFSLKFKNLSIKDNWHRFLLVAATVALVAVLGVAGLGFAIIFYVVEAMIYNLVSPKNKNS